MYYYANCYFQGAVDFVCPRGWRYIKDSKFYEVKETAAVWHAGNYKADQKFALQNCSFNGNSVVLRFDEIVTVRGSPVFENKNGKKFRIKLQRFTDNDYLTFLSDDKITTNDLVTEMRSVQRHIIPLTAYVKERSLKSIFKIIPKK